MAYLPPVLVQSTPHRKRYLLSVDQTTNVPSVNQVLSNAALQANALQPLLSAFQQGTQSANPPSALTQAQARFLLNSQIVNDAGAAVTFPTPLAASQAPAATPTQTIYTPTTVCTLTPRTGNAVFQIDADVDPDNVHAELNWSATDTGVASSCYLDISLEHTLTR